MKPLQRFFMAAALLAATSSASADDFYLCKATKANDGYSGTDYVWHQYYTWSSNDLYKFTDVTAVAGASKPTYQMTIERLDGLFSFVRVAEGTDVSSVTPNIGVEEYTTFSADDLGKTITLKYLDNFARTDDNSLNTDIRTEWTTTSNPIKHLVLTLTDEEDGTYSLVVSHATNHNIYEGVYSFLYVQATAKNGGKDYIDNRLIKADGDNYTIHFDRLEGQNIRILDKPYVDYNDGYCISLGLRWNTTLYPSDDAAHQGEMVLWHDFYKGLQYPKAIDGEVSLNLYQGVYGAYSLVLWPGLDDVDLTFSYDLEHQDKEEVLETDANYALDEPKWYAVNDATGKKEYEVTEEMCSKENLEGYSDDDKAVLFQKAYNGSLLISYKLSEAYAQKIASKSMNFALKSDQISNWAEQAMTCDSDNGTPIVQVLSEDNSYGADAGSYLTYTYDLPTGFDGAFYLIENLTTTTTTTTTTTESDIQSVSSETEEETEVTTFKAPDTGSTLSLDVNPENADSSSKAAVEAFSSTETTKGTVTEGGNYYYARLGSSSVATVRLLYNVVDPSKSIVQLVLTDGTITSAKSLLVNEKEADGAVELYNLNGVRVRGDVPGLYIRRQGNKVSKVIIK